MTSSQGATARPAAEEVLARRARSLAERRESAAASVACANAVLFALCGETYAIEAEIVREVLRPPELTPVPGAPPALRGVTTLRGEILPVFDLAVVLGLGGQSDAAAERALVLGDDADEVVVPVERLLGVAVVALRDLFEARLPARAAERGLLRGCTADAITVIDGRRVLDDPSLHLDDEKGETP